MSAGVLAAVLGAVGSTRLALAEGPVWFWFSTCGGPSMTVEVKLDAATLFKGSFPICRAHRSSSHSQGQTSRLEFSFRSEREIVWGPYRYESERTKPGLRFECDLWQAGADPDALLIGVSFLHDGRIDMNTLHVMTPGEKNQTAVADGLVILTYPTPAVENAQK
jgi:hypothetical protein